VYCETLEVVLQRDPRRTPIILEYVRYPHNIWIQEEAIRIAQFLAARVPDLVDHILPSQVSGAAFLFSVFIEKTEFNALVVCTLS